MQREYRNDNRLNQIGWIPLHFWEKEVLKETDKCIMENIEAASAID